MELRYTVIDPTKNITLLVTTPVPRDVQPRVAMELLRRGCRAGGLCRGPCRGEAEASDDGRRVLRQCRHVHGGVAA